jgi:glycosyltransferase involved in cell wall biosynthesis
VHIYVNSLLPFGAALAGKLTGTKVTYHLHESYIKPVLLKKMLKSVASVCADSAIYVSNYLLEAERIGGLKNTVIYNALPDEFAGRARAAFHQLPKKDFVVLMISSMKEYKGVKDFVRLASKMNEIRFELVLNATQEEIGSYFKNEYLPGNLSIFPVQQDVHPFYQRASIIVNLSNPDHCIETFGMTLIEGMCYGLPAIGPDAGGPAEIIKSGTNGFKVDVRNLNIVAGTIERIYNDNNLQRSLSEGALQSAGGFAESKLQEQVRQSL